MAGEALDANAAQRRYWNAVAGPRWVATPGFRERRNQESTALLPARLGARAGIDALIELAGAKTPRGRTGMLCDNPQVQDAVGRADAILNAGRAYRSAMIAELWATVAAGKETTLEQRARCRLASIYAGDNAREAMDLVYRHGGSTSFQRESCLAECWRDLHVVGQTVTIAPEWYPIGGRVYLGLDPGPRLR
jgi:hypothetical protein